MGIFAIVIGVVFAGAYFILRSKLALTTRIFLAIGLVLLVFTGILLLFIRGFERGRDPREERHLQQVPDNKKH